MLQLPSERLPVPALYGEAKKTGSDYPGSIERGFPLCIFFQGGARDPGRLELGLIQTGDTQTRLDASGVTCIYLHGFEQVQFETSSLQPATIRRDRDHARLS